MMNSNGEIGLPCDRGGYDLKEDLKEFALEEQIYLAESTAVGKEPLGFLVELGSWDVPSFLG